MPTGEDLYAILQIAQSAKNFNDLNKIVKKKLKLRVKMENEEGIRGEQRNIWQQLGHWQFMIVSLWSNFSHVFFQLYTKIYPPTKRSRFGPKYSSVTSSKFFDYLMVTNYASVRMMTKPLFWSPSNSRNLDSVSWAYTNPRESKVLTGMTLIRSVSCLPSPADNIHIW